MCFHAPRGAESNYTGWDGPVGQLDACAKMLLQMAIDPVKFQQFFRRNSSGDWVYVGYGPSIYSRLVGVSDMDWLMSALPKLCAWKRWTVMLFSVPLVWLLAFVLNVMAHSPISDRANWIRGWISELSTLALVLFVLFIVSTAVLSALPEAREFGKLMRKLPREEPMGVERFLMNTGAVNGPIVTILLMSGFGYLFVPGVFKAENWPFFLPFAGAWAWMAWHICAGAFWKPRRGEAWDDD